MSLISRSFAMLVIALIALPSFTFAQEPEPAPVDNDFASLTCRDLLSPASVAVTLAPTVQTTVAGADIFFTGDIINNNDIALQNATFYARVFEQVGTEVSAVDPVVDQFVVSDFETFAAMGTETLEYSWNVPATLPSGTYYVEHYFVLNGQYSLSGAPFTETRFGGIASFEVVGSADASTPVVFDSAATTINGEAYSYGDTALVDFQTPEVITAVITNASEDTKLIPVEWKQYVYSALSEDNLTNSNVELVSIDPGESVEVSYTLQPHREGWGQVVAVLQDQQAKSIIDARYAQTDVSDGYVLFSGYTSESDTEHSVYACSIGSYLDGQAELVTTVVDTAGNEVFANSKTIDSGLTAVQEAFTLAEGTAIGSVRTTFEQAGEVTDEVVIPVNDSVPGAASGEGASDKDHTHTPLSTSQLIMLTVGVIVLLLIIVILVVMLRKKGETNVSKDTGEDDADSGSAPLVPMLFLCALLGFGFVGTVDAAPPTVNFSALPASITAGGSSNLSWTTSGSDSCTLSPGGSVGLNGSQTVTPSATTNYTLACTAPNTCTSNIQFVCESDPNCSFISLGGGGFGGGGSTGVCFPITIETTVRTAQVTVTAAASNQSPTVGISGPTSAVAGNSTVFTFTGTDPDGDQIRYHVDWDANGSTDTSTGFVNSGTNRLLNYTWPSAGSYTVRARTEDSNGAFSSWDTHSISIAIPPASGSISGSGCTITAGNSSCVGNVSWNLSGGPGCAYIWNNTDSILISDTSLSGFQSLNLNHGGALVQAYGACLTPPVVSLSSALTVDDIYLPASCATGTTWNGSVCAASAPTTCSPHGSSYEWNGSAWAPTGSTATWNWDLSTIGASSGAPPSRPFDEINPYPLNVDQLVKGPNPVGSAFICGGATLPAPTTGTISAANCTIPGGSSVCNSSVSWNFSGASNPRIINDTTNTYHHIGLTVGSGEPVPITYGSNIIGAYDDTMLLNFDTANALCATGSSWNGSSCYVAPVVPSNNTPNPPNITGLSNGTTNVAGPALTFVATDPDGDTVRYDVDFDGNGSVDISLPTLIPGGFVNSGTSQVHSWTWTSSGLYTVRARTVDDQGAASGWATYSMSISDPAPATCTLQSVSLGDGTNTAQCAPGSQPPIGSYPACNPAWSVGDVVTASLLGGTPCFDFLDDLGQPNPNYCLFNGLQCNGSTFTPPAPSTPSATVSGSGCTIADGSSTCSGLLTWDINNSATYQVYNTTTGTSISTAGSATNQPITLGYSNNTINVYGVQSGSITVGSTAALATANLSGSCSGTSFWNGSTCERTPVPTANFTINGVDSAITVATNDDLRIEWTSADVSSCTGSGNGWTSGNTGLSGDTGNPSSVVAAGAGTYTYVLNCDSGTVLESVSVTVTNSAPNPPAISVVTTGDTSNNYDFTFTSTDPEGEQIYYRVDWGDGSSLWTSPYTNSGVARAGSHLFTAEGSETITVTAYDASGNSSSASTQVINVVAQPPTMTLEVSVDSSPGWQTTDQTINPSDNIRFQWSSTDATTCTSANVTTGGAANGSDNNVTEPGPGTSIDYEVTCTGSGGTISETIRVNTLNLPNLTQPSVSATPSGADPITGDYSGVSVLLGTSNSGGSDIFVSSDYLVEIDHGDDGSIDDTRTGSFSALTAGASENDTVGFGTTPFGEISVTVTVDSDNDVTESNESDNVRTLNVTVPPPDPQMSLEIDPSVLVRGGNTAELIWSKVATYAMNCSLSGPGVDQVLSGNSGTVTTQPIENKSEYTYTCVEPITGTSFSETESVETTGTVEEI